MRQFLKINSFILLAFFLVPFISLFYFDFTNEITRQLCLCIPSTVSALWIFAISYCLDKHKNSGRVITAIVSILLLLVILSSWITAYLPFDLEINASLPRSFHLLKIKSGLMFGVALLMAFKIKKVLFERSLWWIFVEIFTFPIGVITLTPEINSFLNEEEEKLKK
ncbi:MAG: hypothetical protein IAF38_02990 [Bacteroidia bacterium]|nr:hypothetical protein [Bacteroidia bacterium]